MTLKLCPCQSICGLLLYICSDDVRKHLRAFLKDPSASVVVVRSVIRGFVSAYSIAMLFFLSLLIFTKGSDWPALNAIEFRTKTCNLFPWFDYLMLSDLVEDVLAFYVLSAPTQNIFNLDV